MDDLETRLMRRARRAYEVGRLAAAARRSVLLLPVIGLALVCCTNLAGTAIGGTGLIAFVMFCLWRGQDYRRGVRPGLVAGFVPLILPILAQAGGQPCTSGRCLLLPAVCGLGGLVGLGVMILGLLLGASPVLAVRRA